MRASKYQADGDARTSGPGFGLTVHEELLRLPYRWLSPRIVFVNSMSDLFHDQVPESFIRRVFHVMADTPAHTYQILTKRSQRLRRLAATLQWPENVWMGVSIENQRYAFRADQLREVPAALRFLSIEPMLGPVNVDLTGIGWVIVGGESGAGARTMNPLWARTVRDSCVAAGVPFFFKQWGGRTPKAGGRELDGELWDQMPVAQYRSNQGDADLPGKLALLRISG
jgi:protein gp37